jgi:hypothetical protein
LAAIGVTAPSHALNAARATIPGYTNFNLPDLRGNFLRGVDANSGRDPDAATRFALLGGGQGGASVGSYQGDQFANHAHNYVDAYYSEAGGLGPQTTIGSHSTDYDNGIYQRAQTTNFTGGNETRPKNAAVYYIIKL